MTQIPRIGRQERRYSFCLNPYLDQRYSKCPICENAMSQRKLPFVIHLHQLKQPIALNKTCRLCQDCDLVVAHENEINGLLNELLGTETTAEDYFVLGTLDRRIWKQSMKEPLAIKDMLEHLHDFEEVLVFEAVGGWMKDDEAEKLDRKLNQERSAWKRKIAARKQNKL